MKLKLDGASPQKMSLIGYIRIEKVRHTDNQTSIKTT